MKRNITLISSLLAALAFGGGVFSFVTTGGAASIQGASNHTVQEAETQAARAQAAATRSPGAGRYKRGVLRTYALKSSREILLSLREPAQDRGQRMTIGVSGGLTLTVVREAWPVELQAVLAGASLSFAENGHVAMDSEAKQAAVDALQTPFYIRVTKRGAISSFRFRRGLDTLSLGILKSIVSASAFVQPAEEQAKLAWTAEEADPTGEYVASYRQLSDAFSFEKSRSRYKWVSIGETEVPVEQAGTFDTALKSRFELDESGWIKSLTSEERLRIDTGKQMPIVMSSSSTSLVLKDAGFDEAAVSSADREDYDTVSMVTLQPRETKGQDEQMLGGASLASLREDLRSLRGKEESGPGRANVQRKMGALFRLHPEATRDVAMWVKDGTDKDMVPTVLAALGEAGTAEAQAILAEQATSENVDESTRVLALADLGLTRNATSESLIALQDMVDDKESAAELRGTAALALGNAARQLAEGDRSAEASDVISQLLTMFQDAKTPQQQQLALDALGNTGDPRALAAIEVGIASPHEIVRGSAVAALRFIVDASVNPTIGALMSGDPAASVRSHAIFAAGFRALDPLVPMLQTAAQQDKDPQVRLDAVNTFGRAIEQHPEFVDVLRWSAEHDPSSDVRNAALVYLPS